MGDVDFVEYLSREAQSDVAALHEFRMLYIDGDGAIHVFVEGDEDSAFYMPAVRACAAGHQIRVYVCGGKTKVIEVREAIQGDGFQLDRCLFLVDRDLDDYLGLQIAPEPHTYITDGYSVETYLAKKEAVEAVLVDICHIPLTDRDCRSAIDNFDAGAREFARQFRVLMAWCLAAREAGCKPNFNNAKLGKIFNVVGAAVLERRQGGYEAFKKAVSNGDQKPEYAKIRGWAKRLTLETWPCWLRGKFAKWYLERHLISTLERIVQKRRLAGQRPPRVPAALRNGELFDILGGRLPIPATLSGFLQTWLSAI